MASRGAQKEDPRIKNLRIKTGILKRLIKEKKMYEQEVVDQEAKIAKMKKEGKDEYDIKKQGDVLMESQNMIPDCQRRIQAAYEDLRTLMVNLAGDWSDFADDQHYTAAQQILDEYKELDS